MPLSAASSIHVTRAPGTDEVPYTQNHTLSYATQLKTSLISPIRPTFISYSASCPPGAVAEPDELGLNLSFGGGARVGGV